MAGTPWLSLLALGAVHGINPAMGWLFAVGQGLQERDRRAVARALGPLALGHALAIGVTVLLVVAMGRVLPLQWLRWIVAASLVAVGMDGLVRHRHVRLGGMRVNARELAAWSFLMASVHGAGLMVLPFVLGDVSDSARMTHHHVGAAHAATALAAGVVAEPIAVTAPLIHTLGYLVVTTVLAAVVYEKIGLRILRRAWINVNVLWCAALIAAGTWTLLV